MSRPSFRIWWNLFSVLLFLIAVFLTVLFSMGYQYDTKARDIVKRGVVYFDGILPSKGTELYVDGKVFSTSLPGEFRIAPGAHKLAIRANGFLSWEKTVKVPEDEILRFPQIRLLPSNAASGKFFNEVELAEISSRVTLEKTADGVFLKNSALHYGVFYPYDAPEQFWLADLPIYAAQTRLFPLSSTQLVALSKDGLLSAFSAEEKSPVAVVSGVSDVLVVDKKVFFVSSQGVFEWSGNLDDEPVLLLPFPNSIWHIASYDARDEYLALLLRSASAQMALVFSSDGSLKWQASGIDNIALEGDTVSYSIGTEFFTFHLKEGRFKSRKKLPFQLSWFSRIEDSYHVFGVTKEQELFTCDWDFENCGRFGKIDELWILSSSDRAKFFAVQKGKLTMFDLSEESDFFPAILENFISTNFLSRWVGSEPFLL